MPSSRDITFTPVTPADYPMLRRWLENRHTREWWGEAETALGRIQDKVEGLDRTRPFVFFVADEPVGYIQSWSVGDEVDGGQAAKAPWLRDVPRDAVGVDLFIGKPDALGQGIGTSVLRAFLARLFAEGVTTIVIDPDEANGRAVKAYEKTGFVAYDRYENPSGVTLLMTITPERFAETGS